METPNFSVRDGVRTFKFNGVKIAESSSRQPYKPRWVEFQLFVTTRGIYVLSRIGKSVLFHDESCPVVTRNRLSAIPGDTLTTDYIPCSDCRPSKFSDNGVYPETPRYWAQTSEKAKGVVDALMQYDANGTEYLTHVACELLEEASQYDEKIRAAFLVNTIE
jgi:hypothetical protein